MVQKDIKKLLNPLSYMLSELICNITQHSQSDIVHFFSQYSDEDNSSFEVSTLPIGVHVVLDFAKVLDNANIVYLKSIKDMSIFFNSLN